MWALPSSEYIGCPARWSGLSDLSNREAINVNCRNGPFQHPSVSQIIKDYTVFSKGRREEEYNRVDGSGGKQETVDAGDNTRDEERVSSVPGSEAVERQTHCDNENAYEQEEVQHPGTEIHGAV